MDKADELVTEDLTFVVKSKSRYSKDMKRRLSGWVKGMIAKCLKDISKRRGATLHVVNAAYTSQICHQCEAFGRRVGDVFYCSECKVEYDADYNAAINILKRLYDREIGLYDKTDKIRKLLEYRNSHRLGLLNPDSSCVLNGTSTESELPYLCNFG